MLALYSLILTIGFLLMLPLFLVRRQKYAAGFRERLGRYPKFDHDGRSVIWLHCVSVGEANAARPLVDALLGHFPEYRLVISTTTKTGHEHSSNIFCCKADAVFYFPFDFKFSVRRALRTFRPSIVLLMETEIWPRFINEAKLSGAKIAIVNGRLSDRSAKRYALVRPLVRHALANLDLALLQDEADAKRFTSLGIAPEKAKVTGNLKFDYSPAAFEGELTDEFRMRFAIDGSRPLIVAASTHEPEEQWILDSLDGIGEEYRLLFAPRHSERFHAIAKLLTKMGRRFVRRSDPASPADRDADVILLDSIGELRAVYPLADIVFVGGSLIPHGGQSILEPAGAGKAIVTGPYTRNFDAVVQEFVSRGALIQTPKVPQDFQNSARLYEEFIVLLSDAGRRRELGENARRAIDANRGATEKTIKCLESIFEASE